jgi:hypothetical protein
MLSFKDWNDLFKTTGPTPPDTTYPTVSSGLSLGVALGYALNPALELGLDLDYFLVSTQSKSGTGASASTLDYNFNLLWLGPQVSYVFARVADGKLAIGGSLGLGFGMLMGSSSGKFGTSTSKGTMSGSGIGFKLGLGMDYDFTPGFGLGLDLGYRILSIGKVDFTTTSTFGGTSVTSSGTLEKTSPSGDKSNIPLDYSGLDIKLGFNFRF